LPDAIAIQEALLAAVQAQPLEEVTPTEPVPPAPLKDWLAGLMENVQIFPLWVTVWVFPAIVRTAVREEAPGLAATEYPTAPLPARVLPEVMATQSALLEAVHTQFAAAVTATLPEPPEPARVLLAGKMVKEQDFPDWVIVKVWPATDTVPVRVVEAAFGVTFAETE